MVPDPKIEFDADPIPSFHYDAGPDPASQNDADPEPQHCCIVLYFLCTKCIGKQKINESLGKPKVKICIKIIIAKIF
jgi:hypothetical protein